MRYICFRSLDGSIFWKRGVYSIDSQGIGVSPVDYLSATCRVGRKSCGCYRANAADWDTSRQDVFPEKEWRYTRFPRCFSRESVSPVDYVSATCRVGRKSCCSYRANTADWDTSRKDFFPENAACIDDTLIVEKIGGG